MAWLVAYLYLACGLSIVMALKLNAKIHDERFEFINIAMALVWGPIVLPLALIIIAYQAWGE